MCRTPPVFRNGDLLQLLERCGAWARHLLVGLALMTPDKLLLLTQSAALLVVPLAAGPKALSALRPKLLQVRGAARCIVNCQHQLTVYVTTHHTT